MFDTKIFGKPTFENTNDKVKSAFLDFCPSEQYTGYAARFHIKPGTGDTDQFFVQKTLNAKNRFLMIQLSTESCFQARFDKIKRGGIELLTALLQLLKPKTATVSQYFGGHYHEMDTKKLCEFLIHSLRQGGAG